MALGDMRRRPVDRAVTSCPSVRPVDGVTTSGGAWAPAGADAPATAIGTATATAASTARARLAHPPARLILIDPSPTTALMAGRETSEAAEAARTRQAAVSAGSGGGNMRCRTSTTSVATPRPPLTGTMSWARSFL